VHQKISRKQSRRATLSPPLGARAFVSSGAGRGLFGNYFEHSEFESLPLVSITPCWRRGAAVAYHAAAFFVFERNFVFDPVVDVREAVSVPKRETCDPGKCLLVAPEYPGWPFRQCYGVPVLLIVGIVWISARVPSNIRATKEAELGEAWRIVLGDSNYDSWRLEEERKLRG